jgi:hypothetical protein
MGPDLLGAVLVGGLVAGILDIGAAAAINRKGPLAILRVIASGLIGPTALNGGVLASAWGFLLQLAMSIVIAAIYGLSLPASHDEETSGCELARRRSAR